MNVLAIVMADTDVPQGYTGHVRHFVDALRRGGHHVKVVGYSSTNPRETQEEALTPVSGRFTVLNVIRLAARELFSGNVDVAVITSVGAMYNIALIALCILAGVQIVYDCQDPIVESLSISYQSHPFLGLLIPLLRFTDFLFDRLAAATFVVSPGMGQMMRARGWRSPLHYFYNTHSGVDFIEAGDVPVRFDAPAEDILFVVYEGGLQRHVRGIEEQMEACAHATRLGAKVALWLVGSGEPEYFRDLALQMDVERFVRIERTVYPSMLAAILERADVAVWNGITVGMPSKIFDYIAHGIPILSRGDDSDVNAMCADFVTVYGSSPADLGRALFDFWRREQFERGNKQRRTSAGREFILRLHRESEEALLDVFSKIEQRTASKNQTAKDR